MYSNIAIAVSYQALQNKGEPFAPACPLVTSFRNPPIHPPDKAQTPVLLGLLRATIPMVLYNIMCIISYYSLQHIIPWPTQLEATLVSMST